MAYIVREGGFLIILLARLSAIPGHFTTAVFATVGMGFFIFTLATLLSMPKQLLVVYLGVVIEQSGSGTESTRSKVIKYAVLVLSGAVTIGVAIFLYGKMQQARPMVQAQLQEKRFVMLTEAGSAATTSGDDMMLGDESRSKLYGQGTAGLYSTDDLESSHMDKQKGKNTSRWRWGRRKENKTAGMAHPLNSIDSLEKAGNGDGSMGRVMMADGVRVSFEADSLAHDGPSDDTLTNDFKARPGQPFQHQQDQYYPRSAPAFTQPMQGGYGERQARYAPSPISAPVGRADGDRYGGGTASAGNGYYLPSRGYDGRQDMPPHQYSGAR